MSLAPPCGATVTLATTGTLGGRISASASAADGKHHGALGAARGRQVDGAFDGRLRSADNHLAGRIVIGDVADRAIAGFGRHRPRVFKRQAEKRRHGPLSDRNGLLHGVAAGPEQFRRVADAEGARRAERGVFAKRMPGDHGDVPREIETACPQRPDDSHADGHQGGLGVRGQRQCLFRAFEHDGRQLLAERLVDLFEDRARFGKSVGEIAAHADGLATLTGKQECSCHERLATSG